MTIDTACSGGLVSVDTACRYLHSGQAEGCIVAGANIYLSPEHIQDMGTMRGVSSTSGRCHTFDEKADGYIKAEGVNAVFLKRLDDAVRDGNPIRAVIRATSTNSDGWTPGISNPSPEAQARNIRMAYANAGINDFNETGYVSTRSNLLSPFAFVYSCNDRTHTAQNGSANQFCSTARVPWNRHTRRRSGRGRRRRLRLQDLPRSERPSHHRLGWFFPPFQHVAHLLRRASENEAFKPAKTDVQ